MLCFIYTNQNLGLGITLILLQFQNRKMVELVNWLVTRLKILPIKVKLHFFAFMLFTTVAICSLNCTCVTQTVYYSSSYNFSCPSQPNWILKLELVRNVEVGITNLWGVVSYIFSPRNSDFHVHIEYRNKPFQTRYSLSETSQVAGMIGSTPYPC